MKIISLFICVFLLLLGFSLLQAGDSAYEALGEQERKVVDTVLQEFKKHRLLFLPELGDIRTLRACAAVVEGAPAAGEEPHEEEHLAARAITATPDESGNYQTPTFRGPEKIYTYKELYTVAIGDKSLTVTMTAASKGNPNRQEGVPESQFLEALARSLGGKIEKNRITLP